MKIQLFFEGYEVDIDNNVNIPINKTFDDISDPTKIIVDYSKTVNIPATVNNNNLLGNIYRLDKTILTGGSANIGVYFDPSKKVNFRIIYNSDVLFEGYAKFLSADVYNGYYNFTLYSVLGDIFQKLKSVVLSSDDPSMSDYILNDYLSGDYVDAEYIKNNWEKLSNSLQPITSASITDSDIIGFLPGHRGQYKDFDGNMIDNQADIIDLQEYVEKKWIQTYISQHPGTSEEAAASYVSELGAGDLLDNITDYNIRQFKPYGLKPFIYINKLFDMFSIKCKELTGYEFNIDSTWTDQNNPYWAIMAKTFDYIDANDNSSDNTINVIKSSTNNYQTNSGTLDVDIYSNGSVTGTSVEFDGIYNAYVNPVVIRLDAIYNNEAGLKSDSFMFSPGACVLVNFKFVDVNGSTSTVVGNKRFWSASSNDVSFAPSGEYNWANYIKYTEQTSGNTSSRQSHLYFETPNILIPDYKYHKLRIDIELSIYAKRTAVGTGYDNSFGQYKITSGPNTKFIIPDSKYTNYTFSIFSSDVVIKEKNKFAAKLKYLYKSDEPLFNILIQYTKMFGMVWDIDCLNKKINILPRHKYFENFTVENWDDKIFKNSECDIEPIAFPTKYIGFNYEDIDGYNYTSYRDRYNANYGEKIITTNYDFNTDISDLFESIKPTCISNRSYLSFKQILEWDLNSTLQPGVETITLLDSDSEDQTESILSCDWGFITHGRNDPDNPIYIINDTYLQRYKNTSCWIDIDAYYGTSAYYTRPVRTISIDLVSASLTKFVGCLFNTPNINYTSSTRMELAKDKFIYDVFWKKYIDERYNIQNKKITAYFNLSPIDYLNFRFNKFVTIFNQLFMVNKIIDYDINKNKPTKCELIQITDTDAYTKLNI